MEKKERKLTFHVLVRCKFVPPNDNLVAESKTACLSGDFAVAYKKDLNPGKVVYRID